MSDMFYEDDYQNRGESNAMKALREKAEADSKLIREMRDELSELRKDRELDKLTKVASSKGLDPSVVNLASKAGYELNEAGLDGFLKDFGGVIAKPAAEPEPAGGDGTQPTTADLGTVLAEEQAALEAMAAASQGATPAVGLETVQSQLSTAETPDDVLRILSAVKRG